MRPRHNDANSLASVALVGLGNIGSQVIDQLARMPGIGRVVLVDRDVYEASNLAGQNIMRTDIGKPKAITQARRLRALNPAIAVEPLVADAAFMPPARLQVDLLLTGLDSIPARLVVGEMAWRLGVPWLDAGIDPLGHLVRITGYRPVPGTPCFACALNDDDYRGLGGRHPCQPAESVAPPTNGPARLGTLAAALLAVECGKFLAGGKPGPLFGRQLVLDPRNHRLFVSDLPRNPRCRFDHAVWKLEPLHGLPAGATLGRLLATASRIISPGERSDLRVARVPRGGGLSRKTQPRVSLCLERAGRAAAVDPTSWIRLESVALAEAAHCLRCGHIVRRVHVARRHPRKCPRCRADEMTTSGRSIIERVDANSPAPLLGTTLARAGIEAGDIVRITSGARVRRFVIQGASV